MIEYKTVKTYSGDTYYIPIQQYDREVADYWNAVDRNDEVTMLNMEGGFTGWVSEETFLQNVQLEKQNDN